MSRTIFVVMGAAGQYEDRYDFNVVAFSDEEKAIEEVARLEKQNEYCLELRKIFHEWEQAAIKQVMTSDIKTADAINGARKATKRRVEEYAQDNNLDLEAMGWTKFMFEYVYNEVDYSYHALALED